MEINSILDILGFLTKNIHGKDNIKNLKAAAKTGGRELTVTLSATKLNPHKKTINTAMSICFCFNYFTRLLCYNFVWFSIIG